MRAMKPQTNIRREQIEPYETYENMNKNETTG